MLDVTGFKIELFYVFPCSLVLWISTINCWLQEAKACGVAGAKAAVEELELSQQVESRVKKKKIPQKDCGLGSFSGLWDLICLFPSFRFWSSNYQHPQPFLCAAAVWVIVVFSRL